MQKLQYIGPSHFRKITSEEFERAGVDESRTIHARGPLTTLEQIQQYGPDSTEFVEVKDATAEWLLRHEKGDWKVVEEESEVERVAATRLVDQDTSPVVTPPLDPVSNPQRDGEPSEADPSQPAVESDAPADGGEGKSSTSARASSTRGRR